MLGRAGLGRCRDEQAQVDVGKNGPGSMSRLISSRTGPGRCLDWYRAKFAWAHVWTNLFGCMSDQVRADVERARIDVGPCGPGLMPGWAGHDRCRVQPTRADVGSSKPGLMSGKASSGRCQDEQAQADVGKNGPRSMSRLTSSKISLSPCLVEFVRAHVESS